MDVPILSNNLRPDNLGELNILGYDLQTYLWGFFDETQKDVLGRTCKGFKLLNKNVRVIGYERKRGLEQVEEEEDVEIK
jgi:hypothetical protein